MRNGNHSDIAGCYQTTHKNKRRKFIKRWAFRKSNPAFKQVRNQLLQNFLQPPPTPPFRYIAILSKRYMYFDVPIQFYMIYVII